MTLDDLKRMVDVGTKMKVRLHVEKFDMTGDTPERVEYIVADDDGRLTRPDGY